LLACMFFFFILIWPGAEAPGPETLFLFILKNKSFVDLVGCIIAAKRKS
jgi:hypothetical protein